MLEGRREQRAAAVGHAEVLRGLAGHVACGQVTESRAPRLAQVLEEDHATALAEALQATGVPEVGQREARGVGGAVEGRRVIH